MKTVLVSGASGIVGYGILRSLKKAEKAIRLIGTTIYPDSVAQGFCDIFELAPLTSDEHYIRWLTDVIVMHHVDLIMPGIETDLYKWTECVAEIEKSGVKIVLNQLDLISLCKDKWLFYNCLKSKQATCTIDTTLESDFTTLAERYGLPFLLKPRVGFGSKGIVIVDNEVTFFKHQKNIGSVLMAQPIVGNVMEEYTTSAFCDGLGGVCAIMTLRRQLSKDGYTEKAEVANLSEINQAVQDLTSLLRPVGPTNFQFRMQDGMPKLLEINPRVSSSTSIRAAFGYNESLMAVDFYLDNILPSQPAIRPGRAVRYTEDFIFYDNRVDL